MNDEQRHRNTTLEGYWSWIHVSTCFSQIHRRRTCKPSVICKLVVHAYRRSCPIHRLDRYTVIFTNMKSVNFSPSSLLHSVTLENNRKVLSTPRTLSIMYDIPVTSLSSPSCMLSSNCANPCHCQYSVHHFTFLWRPSQVYVAVLHQYLQLFKCHSW